MVGYPFQPSGIHSSTCWTTPKTVSQSQYHDVAWCRLYMALRQDLGMDRPAVIKGVWIGLDHLCFGMDRGIGLWVQGMDRAVRFDSQPYMLMIFYERKSPIISPFHCGWSMVLCPTPHHSPVEPKIPHLKGELSGDSVQKPWHICAPWPVPLRWFQRFGSEGRLSGERIPYQLTGELRGWTVSNLSIPEWTLGEETTLKKPFTAWIACLVLQTGK